MLHSVEASRLSVIEVLEKHKVDAVTGLSSEEVRARMRIHGPNEMEEGERETLCQKYMDQLKEPLIVMLLCSALISALMRQFDDALSIAAAVLIVSTVAFIQEYRSEKSLEALNKLVPPKCHALRDGRLLHIMARELVPGDVVHIGVGDRVPADCRVLSCTDLLVDESSLTGEALPAEKTATLLLFNELSGAPSRRRLSTGGSGLSITAPCVASAAPATAAAAAAAAAAAEGGSSSMFSLSASKSGPEPGHASYGHGQTAPEEQEIPIAERTNMVFQGTLVCNGHGKAVVVGTGMKTEFGKTFEEMRDMEHRRTPLQAKMDALAKQISVVSFGVITVIGLLGLAQGKGLLSMFQIGVSLAVAAIPEGLPICVTVTLALGVMRMAKRNAIIKKLPSVEALGCATVVCVDKTGTLTQNQMTVQEVFCLGVGPGVHGGGEVRFSGVGYDVVGCRVTLNGSTVPANSLPPVVQLLQAACLCNNAHLDGPGAEGASPGGAVEDGSYKQSSSSLQELEPPHGPKEDREGTGPRTPPNKRVGSKVAIRGQPTEAALLVAAAKFGVEDPRPCHERVYESAFSSEKKFMEVVCRHSGDGGRRRGRGDIAYVKGVVEAVLPLCKTYAGGHEELPLREKERVQVSEKALSMARQGLRVLAVAWGPQKDALTLGGLVGMLDPPRPGVRDSISVMRQSKIRVAMITGDAKETAESIAAELGFYDPGVDQTLSGSEMERMSAAQLESIIKRVAVFYRTSPRHKLAIVRALQAVGEVVAMTGDGVNDAAALKQSDIGVAMGQSGTDVAKEAADMIMVDDNFSTITYAVEEGKSIFYNIKNFLTFQLSTSVAALTIVAVATLMGLDCPLNAMQILWINIIMDGPPAQSLGVEPVDPVVMRRPPRRASDPILNRALGVRVLSNAALITAGTLYVYWKEMGHDGIVSRRDTTMTFTTFVFFDMFNALSCRHAEKPVPSLSPFSNKPFLIAIGGSLVGQFLVIYFRPLQEIFQTEALSFSDLLYIFLLASSLLVLDTIRKVMFRPAQPTGREYPYSQYHISDAWRKLAARLHWTGGARRKKEGGGGGGSSGAGTITGGAGGGNGGRSGLMMVAMEGAAVAVIV